MSRSRVSRRYTAHAKSDAKDTAANFLDEIVASLVESGEASDDLLNDYPDGDSYHHESHVDHAYSLTEAADILDELERFEETDGGLWQGLAPREAIGAQAAYTYGNAVMYHWQQLVEAINDDATSGPLADMLAEITDAQEEGRPTEDGVSAEHVQARVEEIIKEYGS